jgi:uncharacterized membrane protein YoaK (UPF0700 family)/anti-anti-sigma regulatory factor
MLVTLAHSFVLQARLSISLAATAGYTNVIAMLVCGVAASHVTGHASTLGIATMGGQWVSILFLAALLLAFVAGAFVSGLATEIGRHRGWPSIYVLPAVIEIVLLITFAAGVELHDPTSRESGIGLWWMAMTASLAMGLQNATITRISNGVVRTTHLTGVLTDLGHESAQLALFKRWLGAPMAKGESAHTTVSSQRLFLLASIFAAFIAGATLAALAFHEFPRWSMVPPIALLLWIIAQDLFKPICEIEETILGGINSSTSTHAHDGVSTTLPAGVAVFRAIARGGEDVGETRLPDLAAWLARLPRESRIVILDLGGVGSVGPMAASTLDAMFERARRDGRRVIILGLEAHERDTINALSRGTLLDAENTAEDMRAALAALTRMAA